MFESDEDRRETEELLASLERYDAEERKEMEAILRSEDDIDIDAMLRISDEHDAALVGPYRKRLEELRAAGEDETAIYEALIRMAERRGDDHGEVFAVLYGDGSIKGPSEAL